MCPRASHALIWLVAVASILAGCGGSHTTTPTASTTNYTVGGTISGLTIGSVVLANGSSAVSVAAGATSWVFPDSFAPGTGYSVTVKTQPSTELCDVTSGGSGMDTGDVGNVTVVCGFGQWSWNAGLTTANAAGVYGTQGTAAAGSAPGARYAASSWTGSAGDFWLFGGVGYDASGAAGNLNDLWRYSPSTKQWTWITGGNAGNAAGVYGTLGTAAAGNVPGARYGASSWIDASGNLWLFGGVGEDAAGAAGDLNDLWRYSPTTGQWTWISGGNADNAAGVYGTLGTAAASNVPGARYSASSWTDASGNFWLFGGVGHDASGAAGNLNDLWRYSPSSGQWTWISGGNGHNAAGVYGTEATAAASNVPGARYASSTWVDSSGTLWLFGGFGYDSSGNLGYFSDLWQYSPTSNEWTWAGGPSTVDSIADYGVLGTAAATNLPGPRQAAGSWIDSTGNFWLFGGIGYDATGVVGNLNDLWRYSPSTSQWTWISGSAAHNAAGVYGTQGGAAANDAPGGRDSVSSWIDSSGNLWLFGGYGYDSTGALGYLNDLWQFNPSTG